MATGKDKRSNFFPRTSCSKDIADGDSVECSCCANWTHGDIKCSGLPKNIFKNLDNLTNLYYLCKQCKSLTTNNPSNRTHSLDNPQPLNYPSHQDYVYLFRTVSSLTDSIKTIHEDIKLIKPLIGAVHSLQNEVESIKTTLNP